MTGKIIKRFKEKVTDNESAGSLHVPNTKLWNVLACTQHCVTISNNDRTYSKVNMQLSFRGTDSVCLMEGLGFYRNAPISNNYLISLWWYKNLIHCIMLFSAISMYTLNKQAWFIIFVTSIYSNKFASPFSNMMHWKKYGKREHVTARPHTCLLAPLKWEISIWSGSWKSCHVFHLGSNIQRCLWWTFLISYRNTYWSL